VSKHEPNTAAGIGEDEIIRIFASREAADRRVLVPNGDDAAAFVLDPEEAAVITTDTLVEGTHFRFDWSSDRSVGIKLMSVNSSDIAAMGAQPRYAFLSLCIDGSTPSARLRAIADGLHHEAKAHRIALLGGNTTSIAGPMVLTLTLVGAARPEMLISRGRSHPGEVVLVTGTLGDARAGLLALTELGPERARALHPELVRRQTEPHARVEAGVRLGELGCVSAMADISDGLGRDLRRLMAPSGFGAVIDESAVPLSGALLSYADGDRSRALEWALQGGEDYELLLTADPAREAQLREALLDLGVSLSRIGRVSDNPALSSRDEHGQHRPLPHGFAHFD
jgi:thiamine-monophosphate kinase